MPPIEQSCYWLSLRRDALPAPPLEGHADAEFVVIGAGFTGLWTSWFIKQLNPDADVAVVEQGIAGYGASGRNAGIVSDCIDHSHGLAITHFGPEEAEKLARVGLKNIEELGEFAADCEFERVGQLHVALTPAQIEECKHTADTAREVGIDTYKLLSAEEVRAELNSPLYLGAVQSPGGGIINPIKLVDKLKRETTRLGVRFYEGTQVTSVEQSKVRTALGSIGAKKIVLATDAYTHHLFPQLLWRFIPLYDYILVSEPLTAQQKDAIGWRNRQGITDGRTFFNYYRLTSDNRILWGTSEAMYYPPNLVGESCDHSEAHYRSLRESFARHFPQIAELEFTYAWGGPIASTTRLTPFFGSLENGKVLYGLGYTGHGIGTTRVAGKILAHMALLRDTELLQLKMVKEKPFPYPPEPLRSLSVRAVTHSLRQVDAGKGPNLLLRLLDALGIGFSS